MSEKKICLFAGTTEGRELAFFLAGACALTVCVATEYGEILLDGLAGARIRTGRMDRREMERFFLEEGFDYAADATHPYAAQVSENIRAAAEAAGCPYLRIARDTGEAVSGCVYVQSAAEAAAYLSDKEGGVFVTTGMKELPAFRPIARERLFVRVLPSVPSLQACEEEKIPPPHIFAMQGPFSYEMNLASFRCSGARWLVTKQSGGAGGFDEKIKAAAALGMTAVVIGAPSDGGVALSEAVRIFSDFLGLPQRRHVDIVGCGCGAPALLTEQAAHALRRAGLVVGAERLLASLRERFRGKRYAAAVLPEKIRDIIDTDPSASVCVAVTGDAGFYSGAKKLLPALSAYEVNVVPGIGSVAYFAAKLAMPWEDWTLASMHARDCHIVPRVRRERRVFLLTGGEHTPDAVCRLLCRYGLSDVRVTVGERLSYAEESITSGTAEALSHRTFDALSCMLIENPAPDTRARTGIPDTAFVRGQVPMTKSEIRALILSKLALSCDSVVYDIGAGTGSVSVECALTAWDGTVYAVEKNPEGIALISQNAERLGASNVVPVQGTAPDALRTLPVPTHAFIGGSAGNLREILMAVLEKNPDVRMVISAVTLETTGEAISCFAELGLAYECVLVNISRSRGLGGYRLMQAQNPIYLFLVGNHDESET